MSLVHRYFATNSIPGLLALVVLAPVAWSAELPAAAHFRKDVKPLLTKYCSDCHMDGEKKGNVSFDEFKSDAALTGNHELWLKAVKNVRAGLMPPGKKPRPTEAERKQIEAWVKYDAFGLNARDPDPGRVTIRRLNRVEYKNTIRDLMGIDFKAVDEFPPDDTGYGFDNVGDVLTVSPLLLEKYMEAAEAIVAEAVPTVAKVVKESIIHGRQFVGKADFAEDNPKNRSLGIRPIGQENTVYISFYSPADLSFTNTIPVPGDYRLGLNLAVRGDFNFDPGRCKFVFCVDGQEKWQNEFMWIDRKNYDFAVEQNLTAGEHCFTFKLLPLTPVEKRKTSVDMQIVALKVQGPLARAAWVHPKNYERFFAADEPPAGKAARKKYAREVLSRFAKKAFRRPVDDKTLASLVAVAEEGYSQPGKRFEEGVSKAMVALLSSPRFLFRQEDEKPGSRNAAKRGSAPVDEYALASRLSYFLWSTMPDDELFRLAERGELRKNRGHQVKRMLEDSRSKALVENFTGQWLEARDVDAIQINARSVLARDDGDGKPAPPRQQTGFGFGRGPRAQLDGPLRTAMRQETELLFQRIVKEDRSVVEFLDCDYTYLNEALAKHYGMTNVTGTEMRLVNLPPDSPRGGVLTQGSMLVVTSNPTRTSPVKRGLFILENLLGTPPAPPPPDIPALEESSKEFKDREPTMREALELHRNKPLCASCHARMDPLGFALENFNAMGMWREKEFGQKIDAAGKLVTGEQFPDVRELKKILVKERRADFYRCLSEKLLTYALGRGLEYYDLETVDQIMERLSREDGRFSGLLMGIIESTPFQKRRNAAAMAAEASAQESAQPVKKDRIQAKLNP